MKIGFDAKRIFHNSTGLGNYGRDLIRILSEFYPKNTYFLYNPKPKRIKRLALTDNIKEVLPDSWIWKKLSSLWRQKAMVKQVYQNNVSIFHGLSGEIPKGLQNYGIKSVVTIHDLIFMRYPEWYSYFDRKIHFAKFKYAAQNTNKIVAISEQTKADIVKYLDVSPDKIEIIYQGCNKEFKLEKSQEEKQELLDEYNLPSNFILNVGTIERRKNLLSVVKAIKNLDINLVVVGKKTEYFKEVSSYIIANNLQHKVYFLEGLSLKELSTIYQIASIFIYPSIFEGFGIPIIEALNSKTPVITSKEGVFPEAGGPDSKYVNPLDSDEISSKITEILASSKLSEKMKENGYAYVQKFNDDVIAKNIMRLYEAL